MRKIVAGAILLLFGWKMFGPKTTMKNLSITPISPDQARFIEEKVKENFAFVMDCYDHHKREGNNVLQWLFGATIGGIGLVGTLVKNDYWCLAVGALAASAWAAITSASLIDCLKSNSMQAPGNSAESLKKILDEPEHRMRWRESLGLSKRAAANEEIVGKVALGVDLARIRLTRLPIWFVGGAVLAYYLNWYGQFLLWVWNEHAQRLLPDWI